MSDRRPQEMESISGAGRGMGGFHLPNQISGGRLPELGIGLTPLPPMKSNGQSSSSGDCTVREQDRFMPIANVIRIMRKKLPSQAKISDEAKETIQECVSEFISFITGEANERCKREQRKTVTAEDVLWAMNKLGFDDYIEPLTMYLHRSRLLESGDQKASLKAAAQFGKRSAEHFPLPPLSPTPYGARPPPSFGRHYPPTGFFIPTPATPGNGISTTTNNNHGAPSSSVQKQGSGRA